MQHKSTKAAQVSSSSSTKAARQSGTVKAECRMQLKSTKGAQQRQLDEAALQMQLKPNKAARQKAA
jgi:hypothetical protein